MIRKQLEQALAHLPVMPVRHEGDLILMLKSRNDGLLPIGIYQNRIEADLTNDDLSAIHEAQAIVRAVMNDCIFD